MKSNKFIFIVCSMMLIVMYFGCSSSKSEKSTSIKIKDPQGKIGNVGEQIPPGITRFKGTVVFIDSTLEKSSNPKSPCSKSPCWAKVRVNSVIGFGAGGPVISKSDTILVKFAFTLARTTKDMFPNIIKQMPGLQVGSSFRADLHRFSDITIDNKHSVVKYTIYTYKKL